MTVLFYLVAFIVALGVAGLFAEWFDEKYGDAEAWTVPGDGLGWISRPGPYITIQFSGYLPAEPPSYDENPFDYGPGEEPPPHRLAEPCPKCSSPEVWVDYGQLDDPNNVPAEVAAGKLPLWCSQCNHSFYGNWAK